MKKLKQSRLVIVESDGIKIQYNNVKIVLDVQDNKETLKVYLKSK